MGTHERLIIKSVNKSYNTEKAIENVIRYIVREKAGEKIRYWKSYGTSNKKIKDVIKQFIIIQEVTGKNKKIRIRHFIVSFPNYMDDGNVAKITAEAISEYMFEEYQIMYAVHEKEGNLHIHFAFNPVSYKTLKKWHISKKEFSKWKAKIGEIINECFVENGYKKCKI